MYELGGTQTFGLQQQAVWQGQDSGEAGEMPRAHNERRPSLLGANPDRETPLTVCTPSVSLNLLRALALLCGLPFAS